jgi:hypothetical protein
MKSKPSPRGKSPRSALSAARLAANRANAQKSTGPQPDSDLVEGGRRVIARVCQNEPNGAARHSSGENRQNEASTRDQNRQNEPSEETNPRAFGRTNPTEPPTTFRQNEATSALNENWQNEPSKATGDVPKKLEAAIPLRGRASASVVSSTTGGTQSASVRQNGRTKPAGRPATFGRTKPPSGAFGTRRHRPSGLQPSVNASCTALWTPPPMTGPPPATWMKSPIATAPRPCRGVGMGAWLSQASRAGS